ncbi:MAG: hypothetical protein WCY12_05925 [Candidatus Omnitrophota bacterium]|jgi:tetratricopeptide (TPR) repeat protein
MRTNEKSRLIKIFFVGWLVAAAIGILLVISFVENKKLDNALAFMKQNFVSANIQLQHYKQELDIQEQTTVDFMQWRYVLKDQVSGASQELAKRINKVRDIKKDRELLNLLYYNLGLNAFTAFDFKAAIDAFSEALKYDANDSKSNYNLGLLYSAFRQDTARALKYYKRFLELSPNAPEAQEVKDNIRSMEKR